MSTSTIRVRFAPAPTGMMHLGNIRTALMNALFSKRHDGTFVLRIEDTDPERNYDPEGTHIIADLHWLGLVHDEGPQAGGQYGPYFQSQRTGLYQVKLQKLVDKKLVYRCFCSEEKLTQKRKRQRALKLPPRYDRTCLHRSADEVQKLCDTKTPFIWRLKLDHAKTIHITDLAHKQVTFELKNFSDFPVTRQNGSFTFMFANCVDDILMNITHVFRGEDHLTNTAGQATLYGALNVPLPTFWHMPILCNTTGKKLSKRDFGFALRDLRKEGFTSEAIVNYLAIIGASYKDEVMSFDQLVQTIELDAPHTTGHITYDVEKLRWLNRKWIERYTPEQLAQKCEPFIREQYPDLRSMNIKQLEKPLQIIKTDMRTLKDSASLLAFYFDTPQVTAPDVHACIGETNASAVVTIIRAALAQIDSPETFVTALKNNAKQHNVSLKSVFWCVRLALTGKTNGPGIHELVTMLGTQKARTRIENVLNLLA